MGDVGEGTELALESIERVRLHVAERFDGHDLIADRVERFVDHAEWRRSRCASAPGTGCCRGIRLWTCRTHETCYSSCLSLTLSLIGSLLDRVPLSMGAYAFSHKRLPRLQWLAPSLW